MREPEINPDNYSKTLTLHMLYRLLDLVHSCEEFRSERDGLSMMLDDSRKAVSDLGNLVQLGLNTSCQDCDEWCKAARATLQEHTPWLLDESYQQS